MSPSKKLCNTASRPQRRQKSAKEKARDSAVNAAHIENKVEELAIQVGEGILSVSEARVSLETWCREEGCSAFNAGKWFDEMLEQLPPGEYYVPSKSRLSTDELISKLKQLMEAWVGGSKLESSFAELSKQSGMSISHIKRIWDRLRDEAEQAAEIPVAANSLEQVQKIKSQVLPIKE